MGKARAIRRTGADQGPVLVTIEYHIDPQQTAGFLEAVHGYQWIRRRDGAIRWDIFHDAELPGKYLKTFVVQFLTEAVALSIAGGVSEPYLGLRPPSSSRAWPIGTRS